MNMIKFGETNSEKTRQNERDGRNQILEMVIMHFCVEEVCINYLERTILSSS